MPRPAIAVPIFPPVGQPVAASAAGPQTITHFDRLGCRALPDEVVEVLTALGRKHGLEFERHGSRFDVQTVEVKGVFKTTVTASGMDAAQERWNQMCSAYGLLPRHYMAKFAHRGEEYMAVGFEPSRPKYALRARRVLDGKEILFDVHGIAYKLA